MKKILQIINRRGIFNTIRFFYARYRFLLKYRISVSKILSPQEVGVTHPYANNYEAISHFSFNRIIRQIDWPWDESTFVDFGCGKGAAILLAEKFNFKRYIGIELSPQLIGCCLGNIRQYKHDLLPRTNLVIGDAAFYKISADANVFYFFNPFQRPVLESVLQNIKKSLDEFPRKIIILYFNAVDLDLVLDFGYRIILEEKVDKITLYGFGNYVFTNS